MRGSKTLGRCMMALAAAAFLGAAAPAHAGVTSVAISDTGTIVAGSTDHTAKVWSATSASPVQVLHHRDTVAAVAISKDGRRIVTGSADKAAVIWDAETGAPLLTLPVNEAVSSLAYSADGRRVVTGGVTGVVQLWDADTGALISRLLPEKPQQAFAVEMSPAGDRIAAGYKFETLLFDAATGGILKKIRHGGRALAFAQGKNEIMLLAGWSAVLFVDLASDGPARGLPDNRTSGFILSLALSPDGALVATGRAEENGAEIWETGAKADSPPILSLPEPGAVNAMAFSADSREIVTGSADGAVDLWDVKSGRARRLSN